MQTCTHNTHIHTYTHIYYIVRTPNNNVKNTSPTITKKFSETPSSLLLFPFCFFCLLRLITFHEVSVLCRQNYPGIYSRVVLPIKRAGSEATKVIIRVYVCFCLIVDAIDFENAKANRMKQTNERETGEDERRFILRRSRAQVESQSADDASRHSSVRPAQQAAGREQCRQWAMQRRLRRQAGQRSTA